LPRLILNTMKKVCCRNWKWGELY